MESYPVNVLLAVLAAFITLLLGFIPSQQVPKLFFQRHVGVAAVLWLCLTVMMPGLFFYTLGVAILCIITWYLWGKEKVLQARVWQSCAAAIGLTLGVMTVLVSVPQAVPAGMPRAAQSWFIAGPYLAGAVLAAGYVLAALAWQYSAVETDKVRAGQERTLLRTVLTWNLVAMGVQVLFALLAMWLLPQMYPEFGPRFVAGLTSFQSPDGQAWVLIARMACGFLFPFLMCAWLYNHVRSTPAPRWFWWPLLAMLLQVVGQLLALQLHV